MTTQPTVLVTGGAGYIGSHTAKELARAGYRVVVYDNLSRGHRSAVRWGPFEEGDLLDQERLRSVLAEHRIDAVLHFAAFVAVGESMQPPELYFHNNVERSTEPARRHARHGRPPHRLLFHLPPYTERRRVVPITEDNPKRLESPYGESKLMVETVLHWEGVCHGLQWMALALFQCSGLRCGGRNRRSA